MAKWIRIWHGALICLKNTTFIMLFFLFAFRFVMDLCAKGNLAKLMQDLPAGISSLMFAPPTLLSTQRWHLFLHLNSSFNLKSDLVLNNFACTYRCLRSLLVLAGGLADSGPMWETSWVQQRTWTAEGRCTGTSRPTTSLSMVKTMRNCLTSAWPRRWVHVRLDNNITLCLILPWKMKM